jgi:hypothetical protein
MCTRALDGPELNATLGIALLDLREQVTPFEKQLGTADRHAPMRPGPTYLSGGKSVSAARCLRVHDSQIVCN